MSTQVAGILRDPLNRPIVNAVIEIRPINASMVLLPGVGITAMTNALGEYNFILEPASYAISVRTEGRNVWQGAITVTTTTPPSSLPELINQSSMEEELPSNIREYFNSVQLSVKDDADRAQASADGIDDKVDEAEAAADAAKKSASDAEQDRAASEAAYQKTKTISDKYQNLDDAVTQTQQNVQKTQSDASKTASDRADAEASAKRAEDAANSASTVNIRNLRVPDNETINSLPAASSRANSIASFDSSGQSTVTPSSSFAMLDQNGKIPLSEIPAAAITEVFPVSSQAEMLSLSAQPGDVAIRSDNSNSYILMANPASDLASWKVLTNDVLVQLAMSSGSSKLGFILKGVASAISRTLDDKVSEVISVKDFGAKGDGAKDDTAAFNAAAAWAASRTYGVEIIVPAGRYVMTGAVVWQGGKISWRGEGVQSTFLNWNTGSSSGGFIAGNTTGVDMFRMSGIYMWTDAIIYSPAISITFAGSAPKNCVIREVTVSGGAVGGTASGGYWQGGHSLLVDPVYPALQDCYFYGIGGATSVAKSKTISSCFAISAKKRGVFFTNIINCFGNGADVGLLLQTLAHPGIEGAVIWGCNFNSTNIGISADASGNPDAGYRPPQVYISDSQVEYIQRGFSFNNVSTVRVDGVLAYADATADEALTHVYLYNVENFMVTNSTMHSRPIHTKCNGVLSSGECSYGSVHDNLMTVSPTGFGVVFGGATRNSRQYANRMVSGNPYSNSSSNKTSNTAEPYEISGEYSHTVGDYVEKFGSVTINVQTNGIGSVNFKVPFPNSILSVIATNGDYNSSNETPVLGAFNVNAFDIKFPTAPASVTTRRINFIARGK